MDPSKLIDLPSYRHPSYRQIEPALTVLKDTYENLEGKKSEYLTKQEKEHDRVYRDRVDRAEFDNKIRPIIDSSAGLLSAFEVANLPPSVEAAKDDIDGQGTDLKSKFLEADTLGVRDNKTYVFIDYPPVEEGQTLADQMLSGRRPYINLIDRRRVYNWRYHYEEGRLVIDRIVFSTQVEKPDGKFGVKSVDVFHQFDRVRRSDENGNPIFQVLHETWEVVNNGETEEINSTSKQTIDLDEIPIVSYPECSKPFDMSPPRFLKAARMNIKLFRKESALDEIEYRVNAPTVWRQWPGDVPDDPPPIIFGPSWIIEVPQGGAIGILELNGGGVTHLQTTIAGLREAIEAEGVGFLTGGAQQERTATEAVLTSAQMQATLQAYARHKAAAIKKIFDLWCKYTGEQNTIEVNMDSNLLEMPLDSAEMGILIDAWTKGAIDHETLLKLLKTGKQLPPDTDIDEILQRAQEERAQQIEAAANNERAALEAELATSTQQAQQQAAIEREQAKFQADVDRQMAEMQAQLAEQQAELQAELAKEQATHQSDLTIERAKEQAEIDLQKQAAAQENQLKMQATLAKLQPQPPNQPPPQKKPPAK